VPRSAIASGVGYDQLTVASLRARFQGLSVERILALVTYEQAHASRATIIAMFERRVAKLESLERLKTIDQQSSTRSGAIRKALKPL
jgi:hypothetical protein